jgi:hypothetical protein
MPAPDGQTPYDFVYDEVKLTSDRGEAFDIASAVLEMSLFEHLWKPYMHGKIVLVDTADLFQSIQFRGTEKLSIRISFPNDVNRLPYKKKFVITNIESHKKGNDNAALIIFNIVEEHFYRSKIKKISRAYEGKPREIIEKILRDADPSKKIEFLSTEVQEPFRYLVPYLTPIQAIEYVIPKATTRTGLPYFLYSPISLEDKLVWNGLNTVLSNPLLTPLEFIYSQFHTGKQDTGGGATASFTTARRGRRMPPDEQGLTIENYQHWNAYDLLSRIESGSIGADFTARNMNEFDFQNFHHQYPDALEAIQQFLPGNQRRFNYDDESWGGVHTNDGERIYLAYLSVIYSDGFNNPYDMEMQENPKRTAIAHALRQNMKQDNIDIQVPGYNFFTRSDDDIARRVGSSIGRSIRLLFMTNDTEFNPENPDEFIDKKLSGQYFITAAHHHFDDSKYTVSATCSKYSELNE